MTAKIYHAELWGVRESKYSWLQANDINTTKWKGINPKSDFYLFIPRDERILEEYEKHPKITDIFPVNSVGIVTARDNLTIQWTKEEVWQTVLNFSRLEPELARQTYDLGKDVRDWKVEYAQKDLKEEGLDRKKITPILYRPFDIRYTYYTGKSRGFICMPRPEVMQHMLSENMALCVGRSGQVVGIEKLWNIVFCSNHVEDFNLFYRGGNVNFPLYTYQAKANPKKRPLANIMILFEPEAAYGVKNPNLSAEVIEKLTQAFKKTPSPEEIFHYIYAVLYSGTYRTKYAEFLKIDFPRVPFTKDYTLFKKMSEYGKGLVELHLLKSVDLDSPIARFQGKGDNRVEKPKYDNNSSSAVILAEPVPACRGSRESFLKKDAGRAGMTKKIKGEVAGCVYINKEQYFEGILYEVWNYQIGGYQVCDKWLKDRKGRILSLEEIQTYCRIVTAIQKTIEIQKAIDKIYTEIENNLFI